MFSQEDILQMQQKGITEAQIEAQLECFRKGFDFLKLRGAASVGDGIIAPTEDEAKAYIQACQKWLLSKQPSYLQPRWWD